jgi:hypothetical protein
MNAALAQTRSHARRSALSTSVAIDAAILVVLAGSYLVTRSANLLAMPMFIDEMVYAGQATFIETHPFFSAWYFPIGDSGVPPLFAWLAAPFARVITNPLLAVRVASMATGALGLIPVWWSGRLIAGREGATIATALYVCCPFLLFYQRLGMLDALLASCSAWAVLFSLLLLLRPRRAYGVLVGLSVVAATWSKAFGVYVAALPVLVWLLAPPADRTAARRGASHALSIGLVGLVALLLAPSASGFFSVAHSNTSGASLGTFLENPGTIAEAFWLYATPPLVTLAAVGALIGRKDRAVQLLGSWFIASNAMLLVLPLTTFCTRYALAGTIPLILLATSGLAALRARLVCRFRWRSWLVPAVLIGAVGVFSLAQDAATIADPATGTYVPGDRLQYVTGWPSGYGIARLGDYIRRLAAAQPVTLVISPRSMVGARLREQLPENRRVTWCVTTLLASRAEIARSCAGRPALLVVEWPDDWRATPSYLPSTAVFSLTQEDGSRIALYDLPAG